MTKRKEHPLLSDPDYNLVEKGDKFFVINKQGNEILKLNKLGAEIWRLSNGTRTLTQIIEEISSRYPDDFKEQIKDDIIRFIDSLEELSLIAPLYTPDDFKGFGDFSEK